MKLSNELLDIHKLITGGNPACMIIHVGPAEAGGCETANHHQRSIERS